MYHPGVLRPDDEPPWAALRRALAPVIAEYSAQSERAQQLARLASTTSALATRNQEKPGELARYAHARDRAATRPDPGDLAGPRPRALIAAAL